MSKVEYEMTGREQIPYQSVVQKWLGTIPIRMQSTLLLSLRGDDSQHHSDIKKITRWMRGLVFIPGNPNNVHEFMTSTDELPKIRDGEPIYKALDYCTVHYYSHLMHGLEIIAYKHPSPIIQESAWNLYSGMVDKFHLRRESRGELDTRLRDLEWPEGKQPQNFEQAQALLRMNMFKEPQKH